MSSEYLQLIKQPSEQLVRAISFANRLGTGVTLSTATATVTDMETGDDVTNTLLTSGTGSISSPNATFTFRAGTDGRKYKVKVLGTFDNTEVSEVDIILTVREL